MATHLFLQSPDPYEPPPAKPPAAPYRPPRPPPPLPFPFRPAATEKKNLKLCNDFYLLVSFSFIKIDL